jgi:hypothetical protein
MRTIIAAVLFICILGSTPVVEAGSIKGKVEIPGENNLENLVVYVDGVKGSFPIPEKRPFMNHLNLQFVPRTLAVTKGTTVDFPNSDNVLHSAFSISKSNPFELGIYGQGHEKFVTFKNTGLVELFCHIHSHMHAYLLVLENPLFSMTAKDGSYTIANVPSGTYNVKTWVNPSDIIEKTVTIDGNETVTLNFTLTTKR